MAIFNPGRNTNQKSLLRLINPGAEDAEVTITAIDDAGTASGSESGETGAVHLIVPAGGARTVSATALESKGERGAPEIAGADPAPLTGELGVGAGKWQLLVTSEQPVVAMSLLKSPTGHLTNLSTAPYRATSGDNVMRQVAENTAEGEAIGDPVTVDLGADATLTHSLEGPDAESFAIDAASGQLRTREGAVYDFEARSGFELIVKVTDGLGGVVRIPVTVEVTDVDEPPDKPTPPEVEGVSSRSVRVSWDEPENTGPEITDYDVAYRRPGAQEYTDAEHEGAGREIEITHLRERADYEFRVRASNAEGTGTWSEPTVGRARSGGGGGGGGGGTITPPPPPPPATNEPPEIVEPLTFTVQENDLSVGRVQATDANRGDSITGFAITGGADDSLFEIAANGNLSFLTAPDHERPGDRFNANPINDSRNNEYIIEIEAQSGTGARTMTSDPEPVTVTNVDEPPLRPDRPAVESSTQNSLSITWQPPVNTGPTITDYDYRYQKQGSGSNWDEVIDTTVIDTRATIIDLDEETDYNIQVRATNDEGTSLWSRSGTGTTQDNQAPVFRERPRAFRNVAENTTGTVDLGGPLTADDNDGGTPAYSLEGADAGRFQIDDGTGQLRTASGAAYDHEADPQHEVTVRADDGQGGSSTIAVTVDVLDELEPPVSPAPPRVTTLSTTSVAVTWTAPANAGRPPIRGYDVQRRIKDSGDSYLISNRDVRGTSATTGNLDPQTTYEVQVRANNDEGEGGWSLPGNGMTDLTTPAALFVAITSDAGSDDYYKLDDEIEATVTFSEAVAVRGSPQLSLTVRSNPRRANYADGSGTAQLIFAYEVTDTDTDTDGVSIEADALQLNGGTVRKDGYTLDAILTHGALTDNSRHKVDGIKPRLIGLEANGTRLTLTYSETLDDSPGPASGDFQVAAGATAQTVQSAVASGVQVTLTLASDVALGDAVAVTYTAGTNPIRDLAQNAAAEFSSRAATNLTAGVCNRTQQVEDAIVAATPVTACGEVTAEHLAGIGYLELSSEGIGELQVGDFAGLTGLNDLFLDGNLLETLPDGLLSGLSALQLLWLDDNQLNALPAGAFSGLSALVTLDLEGNDLDSVDEQFFAGLTALEKLDLSDNSLETLPAGTFSDLAALESLNLEDNALSALTAGVFSALVALEELDLSHNALDDLAGSPFSSLAALTWLDLDGNDFETLPAGAFSGLAKLRTLWLADNEITMLPETVFSGLTATTWIDLDGNQLATLPGDLFDGLSNLARLWLADNQFTVLPDGIFSGLTALRRLKLEENPTDPLPLTVALQSSSSGRFQVSVPAGAPFAMTFPVRVTNGSLSGSGASVAIAQGSTHSSTYSVSRTSGSTATVDIAALPPIPDADTGYELVKSADLPLEVIAPSRAVKIFPTALTVREGGDNRYRAVLNSKPSADATITVTVPSGTDVEANPTSLTFTPDNWQDPQWVTVSAMTDTDTDDDSVTLSHSVQGGDYQGVSAAGVAVTVAENLPATNESPSIASDDEFELTEHNAAAGAVAASDADTDDYITGYAISGGVDAGQFEITDDGALSFVTPPNHETPQDLASTSPLNDADNNEYIVQVEATGGTGTREQTVTQTITVTVNDADEPPSRPPAPVVLADDQAPRYLNVRSARERLIGTGPEITDYDVQYRVKDSGDFLPWPYSGAELDATITGLERDTAYEVQVRATNDEGTSDWSPSGQATTHNAAPQPDTRRILADVVSAVGAAVEIVDLSGTFREPDNDGIGFSASSSNSGVASVTLVKSFLAISPGSAGTATITVTASDPYGASATRTFKVTVRSGALRTPTASISGDTLTVEFTDRFAADEVRAYQIRVRQSSPRGRWVTRCTAVAKPTQGNHSVALNATIAGLFEPGTTYEVDYGHTGTACGGGLAARSAAVEQATAGSSSFDIELVYVGTGVTSALRTAANAAAERWGRIITGDIPNVDYSRNPVTPCWRVPLEPRIDGVVDDVRIYVEVQAIDGSGGAVATGQACRNRDLALLPIVSVVEMDSADLGGLGTAVLQNVVLHELGHALGFDGSLWKDHGLLKNPSLAPGGIEINPAPDTHFNGVLARTAFNAAGGWGSSYTGAKVPVENGAGRGSARDSHWRFSVFGRELMATGIYSGGVNPLSAVTVRAFADMGYQVDVSQADTYALSSFSGRLSAGGSPSQLRCGFEQPVRTTGEFQPMDPKPAKPSRASLPAPRFRRGVPERPRDLRR